MSGHLVHGMSDAAAPPDWPPLQDHEVDTVLRRFGIELPAQLHWHSPRPFSAAAEVHVEGGRLFVKRHHRSVRDARALHEEHRYIAHLRAHGVPAPDLLATPRGESALEHRDWTYEVQRAGAGTDRYRDAMSWTAFTSNADAHAAGRMLARLHRAAAGYAAPPRSTDLLVANARLFTGPDPITALRADLQRRPRLARWMTQRDWVRDISKHLLPWHASAWIQLQALPPLWTHGDWHPSNLLWSDAVDDVATVTAVFDFGLSDRSFALFDLATAIERTLIPWLALDEGHAAVAELDQLDALLHGYMDVLPLDGADLCRLAALLPLVHADFALSELEYFAGITLSPANAAIAYERYLLGHADWFGDSEGQRLLRHLLQLARRVS